METLYKVLTIGALLFICIAYPIFIFISIWSFPAYVVVAYLIWIILSFGWIIFSNRRKLSEYIIPIILFDVVFTIIYVSGSQEVFFLEDEKIMPWIAPSLCLPAIIYVALKLGSILADNISEKEANMRNLLKNSIEQKIADISVFKNKLQRCNLSDKVTNELIDLIVICSNNTTLKSIYENALEDRFKNSIKEFKGIIPEEHMPKDKREFDLYIEKLLKSEKEHRSILHKLNSYDYKQLRKLFKEYI